MFILYRNILTNQCQKTQYGALTSVNTALDNGLVPVRRQYIV